MAFLTTIIINGWLEPTKLTVVSVDSALDSFAKEHVFGVLAARYDTSSWLDTASAPDLVIQLVAMRYAATYYRRQYSEDLTDDPAYPVWLEATVQSILDQIAAGTLDLLDAIPTEISGITSPGFYPNDAADTDDPRKFTMAMEF